MSIHTWADWQVWLLDANFIPVCRLDDLRSLSVDGKLRDQFSFTASLLVSSRNFDSLSTTADQYLLVNRLNRWMVFAIENIEERWKVVSKQIEKVIDIAGRGQALLFLGKRIVQPNPATSATTVSLTGKADDVIKELIRQNCVTGTAYDDKDGDPRGWAGLTVAADAAEYPDDITIEMSNNLWDAVKSLCLDYDIDLTVTPTWTGAETAVTFEVDTHYQGRGTDKSAGTASPVILSDLYKVLTESSWHVNRMDLKTHAYLEKDMSVQAGGDAGSYARAEMVVNAEDLSGARRELLRTAAETGHSFGYRESAAIQLGRDFWLGDTISHHDTQLSTPIISEHLAGFRIQIKEDKPRSEQIILIFGDEKPSAAQDRSSVSGGSHISKNEKAAEVWVQYWNRDNSGDAFLFPITSGDDVEVGGIYLDASEGRVIADEFYKSDNDRLQLFDGGGTRLYSTNTMYFHTGGAARLLVMDGQLRPAAANYGLGTLADPFDSVFLQSGAFIDHADGDATHIILASDGDGQFEPKTLADLGIQAVADTVWEYSGATDVVLVESTRDVYIGSGLFFDNSTGKIETAGVYAAATTYLNLNATQARLSAATTLYFQIAGANAFLVTSSQYRLTTDLSHTLGGPSYRWDGGYFGNDVQITAASKGIILADNTAGYVMRGNGSRYVGAALTMSDLPAAAQYWTLTGDVLTTNAAGHKVSLTDTLTVTGADIEVYA